MRPAQDPAQLFRQTTPTIPVVRRTAASAAEPMEALYRAALGPINAERYLPVFERFDATGRSTTHWNWTACLSTFNWLVFRKLWWPALLYVAAIEVLGLLLLGVGRGVLQWPRSVEGGVIGAFVLLALVVPGLYGDAVLHTELRKRITHALQTSHTLTQAQALLAQQASSWRRLKALVLANCMLTAAVAMCGVLLLAPADRSPQVAPEPAQKTEAPAPMVMANTTTALAADTGKDPEDANTAVQATEVAVEPVAAPAVVAVPPPAAIAAATLAPAPAPAPAPPIAPPAATATTTAPAPAPVTARTPAAPRAAPIAAPRAAPSAPSALTPVGSAPGYYINVGLFADEANARRTQARLLNEGLPAFRQTVDSAQGPRTRVRVGPFTRQAQAQSAAATIRTLQLEAVVFRQ